MKGQETLFSKKSDHWATPKDIYDKYMNAGFFDPCPLNATFDGLDPNFDWKKKTYVNPPYSDIRSWLGKALIELEAGNCEEIVFLIPARTDTRWFHELIYNNEYATIEFIKGRLKFGDSKNSAPFPSMFVVFYKQRDQCPKEE